MVIVYSYYVQDPRVRREAQALRRAGMDVEVICLRKGPQTPLREIIDGVEVFRVPLRRRRENKMAYASHYALFLLASLAYVSIRTLKAPYRLVHVHNMPDILVYSAWVARL